MADDMPAERRPHRCNGHHSGRISDAFLAPPITSSTVEEEAASDFTPLGALVHSEAGDNGETLEIHHFVADSPQATTFVQRLQARSSLILRT